MNLTLLKDKQEQKSRALFTFLVALLLATLIFLPFIIQDNGLFLYYGDYNVQEIPFYQHVHQMIWQGKTAFDFGTDLGANFVGSYGFYMLGTPFFWLMLPFPNSWIPYLMGPMFILKFAIAALFAYLYLARFLKNKSFAVLGALLYAFSGFAIYNIFFNHFVDVVALFPLLLYGLERYVVDQKKGIFALAVTLNLLVNYFFFVGQVTFLILYFLCRLPSPDFHITKKKFFGLAFESIVGVLGGMVLLLPSLLALGGNDRVSSILTGIQMLFYNSFNRYGSIISSAFFMPELPARPNFFVGEGAKWSSLSLWLPLFSITGVFAFFQNTGKNFVKRLLKTCAIFALIPILNSAFYAFNSAYYARWLYMPILIMALASVKVLERQDATYQKSILYTAAGIGFFSLIGVLPTYKGGELLIGACADSPRFFIWVGISVVSLALFSLLIVYARPAKALYRSSLICLSVIIVCYSVVYLSYGKTFSYETSYMIDTALNDTEQVKMQDDSQFYRSDFYGAMDNLGMFWDIKSVQCFHTVVPSSIMNFYEYIGLNRDVRSDPPLSQVALNQLFSVKYLYEDQTYGDADPIYSQPGFSMIKTTKNFNVYQNEYFIPIGFAYTSYLTKAQAASIDLDSRSRAMLKAVVLEDKDVGAFDDLLTPVKDVDDLDLSDQALEDDCDALRQASSFFVEETKDGLLSKISLQTEQLVFYSIPYDRGFTCYIDGVKTDIIKANVGFMAVCVPEGTHEVRFVYQTPGLKIGLICLAIFAIVWPLYTWLGNRKEKNND